VCFLPPAAWQRHNGGGYWHRRSKGPLVKKIPTGGRLLELAPWTWRTQVVLFLSFAALSSFVRALLLY
jgi:hypothetical protein